MNAEERKKITGGLSKPSKMPGYAYNLPAIHCKTGSKLAQVPGTTCHGCYALKGRYRFPNVMDAMMRRLASISRPDWSRTMAADINARKSRWFRWHDSGGVQSVKHLLKIFQVCRMTPDVAHWLPTREAGLLSKIPQDRVPANLTIRLSATKVDGPAPGSWPLTSTVVTTGRSCPAPDQGNACRDCRACWDRNIKNVAYGKHQTPGAAVRGGPFHGCTHRPVREAQARKGASDQAMSKRSSSGQDSSSQARKLSSPQAHKSRIADPG